LSRRRSTAKAVAEPICSAPPSAGERTPSPSASILCSLVAQRVERALGARRAAPPPQGARNPRRRGVDVGVGGGAVVGVRCGVGGGARGARRGARQGEVVQRARGSASARYAETAAAHTSSGAPGPAAVSG
jgi:hypothetical protein